MRRFRGRFRSRLALPGSSEKELQNGGVGVSGDDSRPATVAIKQRRRNKQLAFNLEHGIEPRSVRKAVRELIDGIVAPAFRDQPEDPTSYALLTDEKALAKEFKRLEKLMLDHARNLEFEQAAAARDALKVLKDRVLLSGA